MFTGIVETLGRIAALERQSGGARLILRPDRPVRDPVPGESIAVEGVCLTVEPGASPERLTFFLSGETLDRTTLGGLAPGALVNMERALAAGDRLGGHFVMGHVDCVGRIEGFEDQGDWRILTVGFPPALRRYLAPKGSVAVDGISLTTVEVRPAAFTVAVIPHTREATSLKTKGPGSPVNLEADMIARYLAEQTALILGGGEGGVTAGLLKRAGFGE